MKKLIAISLVLVAILLCACSKNGEDTQTIYRVLKDEYQTNGELIVPHEIPNVQDKTALETVLIALESKAEDERSYNPMLGIEILDMQVKDGSAKIALDESYLDMSEFSKTLIDACLTLSLCSLDDIDRLSVSVNNEIVAQNLVQSDMILLGDELSNEQEICIYFANDEGTLLIPEYRRLSLADDAQIERYIIGELLRDPSNVGVCSAIPEGTALLGISSSGRTCNVNLSKEFVDNRPETATAEVMAVYSIVNSLTALSNINDVKITVEGKTVSKYFNLSLNSPIEPLDFITAKNNVKNIETRLFFGYKDAIFGVPCLINSETNAVQAVLDRLMSAESFGCYESLFSEQDKLVFNETAHGVCKISVARTFIERRSSADAALALDALVRTLIEIEGISSVMITYDDGSVPLAPYRDLSEAQRVVLAEIIQ